MGCGFGVKLLSRIKTDAANVCTIRDRPSDRKAGSPQKEPDNRNVAAGTILFATEEKQE